MYAKIIPESKPIEIIRNLLLSSCNIKDEPKALSINKIQGVAPMIMPDKNAINNVTSIEFKKNYYIFNFSYYFRPTSLY